MFMTCIKHAMRMTGDVSTHIAGDAESCRLLTSLDNEEFTDTEQQLFGPGFEQCVKIRSETAGDDWQSIKSRQALFFEEQPPKDP